MASGPRTCFVLAPEGGEGGRGASAELGGDGVCSALKISSSRQNRTSGVWGMQVGWHLGGPEPQQLVASKSRRGTAHHSTTRLGGD